VVARNKRDHPTSPADLLKIATDEEVNFPLNGKDDIARRQSLGRRLQLFAKRFYEIEVYASKAAEIAGTTSRISVAIIRGDNRSAWKLFRKDPAE
jgi:hypothetical protein